MNFLTKIEDFINQLIVRLTEAFLRLLKRATPKKLLDLIVRVKAGVVFGIKNFKSLPATAKASILSLLTRLKARLGGVDYKGKVKEYSEATKAYYKTQTTKGAGRFKALIVAPAAILSKWLQGLSAAQAVLLMGFTAASFLAGIKIISTGHRVIGQKMDNSRSPASAEEELQYDRPAYYKKDARHVMVTNVRLPVYIGKVNELRSVDIDFNVTLSNRQSRKFLEKYEFQLRDYLILNIEPLVASFPLEEEGKVILTGKIWREVDNFLKERGIDGEVQEVKITYILAN